MKKEEDFLLFKNQDKLKKILSQKFQKNVSIYLFLKDGEILFEDEKTISSFFIKDFKILLFQDLENLFDIKYQISYEKEFILGENLEKIDFFKHPYLFSRLEKIKKEKLLSFEIPYQDLSSFILEKAFFKSHLFQKIQKGVKKENLYQIYLDGKNLEILYLDSKKEYSESYFFPDVFLFSLKEIKECLKMDIERTSLFYHKKEFFYSIIGLNDLVFIDLDFLEKTHFHLWDILKKRQNFLQKHDLKYKLTQKMAYEEFING